MCDYYTAVCMYDKLLGNRDYYQVCTVITYSESKDNRVRLPILFVRGHLPEQGKIILPCPRSRLRISSHETGSSAVLSRVSLLISILRLTMVLTYGIPPGFRGGVSDLYPVPSLSYSSRQGNEFPWSQANPK